jgi:hypothetical protein
MTNTETIKAALIKQIIDSGSTLPLSVLVGNIDLLINAAANDKYSAISDNVIGSHITEPELTVEDLKAGEWYHMATEVGDFLLKFERIINSKIIKTYKHLNYNPPKHFFTNEPFDVVVNQDMGYHEKEGDKLRHATREEIIKYFPHEFEVDAHGGNDIAQLTDPQL